MLMPLRKYAQFSGRSQRKEFWMWVLFVLIVSVIASIIDRLLGFGQSGVFSGPAGGAVMWRTSGPAEAIVALALLLPNLSVAVRRLHDINRTGWWILAPIVPYLVAMVMMFGSAFRAAQAGEAITSGMAGGLAAAGVLILIAIKLAITLLVFYCLDGTRGPNRFGPDPKGPDLAATFA